MQAMLDLQIPKKADEFSKFVHCCRGLSTSILDFHRQIALLDMVLEEAYHNAGKRKKTPLKPVALHNPSWRTMHEAALRGLKEMGHAVKLSFPKDDHVLCLFTDASDPSWAGVVT